MLAAIAYRAPDGSFLPAEPFEIKRPDEGRADAIMDEFVRWAAQRYAAEHDGKKEVRA